ncbi:MAG: hypothetical protein ACLSHC_10470 [Bilophila wadsworthia]
MNARDLDTLQVDRSACLRLAGGSIRPGTTKHGLRRAASPLRIISSAAGASYQAVLVGTSSWTAARPARR